MNIRVKTLRVPFAILLLSLVLGFALSTRLVAMQNNRNVGNCEGLRVCITDSGINPNEISLKVGETVQFINADGRTHNMGIGGGSGDEHSHDHNQSHEHEGAYASGDFKKGEDWHVTFNETGTYRLHDHYKPENNILVVVYDTNM